MENTAITPAAKSNTKKIIIWSVVGLAVASALTGTFLYFRKKAKKTDETKALGVATEPVKAGGVVAEAMKPIPVPVKGMTTQEIKSTIPQTSVPITMAPSGIPAGGLAIAI